MPSRSCRWIAAASFGFLAAAMAFFPGGSAQAQTVNICDRTPQVETTILAELGVACDAVPAISLGSITALDLSNEGITALDVNDFDGLDGLMDLNLRSNTNLTMLPPGVLDSVLDTLTMLRLDSQLQGEISFAETDSLAVSNTTATISVVRTQPYTAVTVSVAVSGDRADLFTVSTVTIPAGTTQTAIDVGLGLDAINKVVTLTLMPPALVPSNANVVSAVVRVADSPGNIHILTGSSPTATFGVFTEEFGGTDVTGDPDDPDNLIPVTEGSTLFIRFMLSRPLAGNEAVNSSQQIDVFAYSIRAVPADLRFDGREERFNHFLAGIDFIQPSQIVRSEVMAIDDGIVEGPERFRFITSGINFSSNFGQRASLHITPPDRLTQEIIFIFEIQDNDTATATVAVTGSTQEGGAMPTAAVTLSAPLAADTVFTLTLQAGADNPAVVNGADADVTFAGGLTMAAATIPAGSTVSDVMNIHVVNDDAPDSGKQFRVEITGIEAAFDSFNNDSQRFRRNLDSLITRIASGDVAISDDDLPFSTAALTVSDLDAGEFNNEPGIVTLALMPGIPGVSATVNFTLGTAATATATLGEAADYTLAITHSSGVVVTPDPFSAAGGSFRLPGGVTEAVFTVTPVADAVADDGETVVIRVTGVDFSASLDVIVPTTERTVTIADYGILPTATLAGTDATLSEGETHVSTLTFTNPPLRFAATVFLHADGNAPEIDAADYTLTVTHAGSGNLALSGAGTVGDPYSFTLPAGVSEAAIRVFLNEDSLAEAQETLRLTLLRVEFADLGDGTNITLSGQIDITINQSFDTLIAALVTAGAPTEENLTTGTFTLRLSDAPTVSTASFNYAFTGGVIDTNFDATWRINNGAVNIIDPDGSSFVTVPGSTFNEGEADVVFTITPRTDDDNSVGERITLTISNLMHGTTAINNITGNPAHLRITDNDGIRLRIRTFLEGALQ